MRHTHNQAKGPHPNCRIPGGVDRLVVFEEGNWWCRQCGEKGWWTQTPISKEELAQRKAERHTSQLALVDQMHHCQDWMRYADCPEKFAGWAEQQISEQEVVYWGLGVCSACPTFPEHRSLTIPVFYKGKLFDIRHRLLDPENGTKYCSHLSGLTPSFFNLDSIANQSQVYIVEGEKKVITCTRVGLAAVIGVPGLQFYKRLVNVVARLCTPMQELIFIPDPGTIDAVVKVAQEIANKTFVVELWEKPDDFINLFGQGPFLHALEYRRPI